MIELNKQEFVEFFKRDHLKLKLVIDNLAKEQMLEMTVLGFWTVKDIIVHITAWNHEIRKAIDEVLSDKKIWFADQTDIEFNKQVVKSAESYSLDQVLEEWEQSFEELIHRIENLSESELQKQSSYTWGGTNDVITVESLLDYRYRGEGHEGGHAKQIKEYFSNSR